MADTSVKLSGTYDSIEAYNIMVEMQNMSADYEEIRTEAAAAASAATAASTAATNAVNTANTAVSNAQTYAGNANSSASEAAGYAANASTSATNAATSETNASNSASAAASFAVVGVVQAFAGSTTPDGWLLCDGSAVSRTTYAALFAVIGTTYGSGNGSTTFNLPNLVDKFVEGSATAGTVKSAGLPNITGELITRATNYNVSSIISTANGAFSLSGNDQGKQDPVTQSSGQVERKKVNFNASASSSIYGNSTTVQPPAVTMRYIIKY